MLNRLFAFVSFTRKRKQENPEKNKNQGNASQRRAKKSRIVRFFHRLKYRLGLYRRKIIVYDLETRAFGD